MNKTPNPQGKGLSTVLEGLSHSKTRVIVPPKQIDQVTSELFTTLFVLNARFEFKPIVGQRYWLYIKESQFRLFTTAPNGWASGMPGRYVGECQLQEDMTWTVDLNEEMVDEQWFQDFVKSERERVEEFLQRDDCLEDAMPYFIQQLPYYQRLLAFGVGCSLKESMRRAGINKLAYQEARALLTSGVDDGQ